MYEGDMEVIVGCCIYTGKLPLSRHSGWPDRDPTSSYGKVYTDSDTCTHPLSNAGTNGDAIDHARSNSHRS